ncbi:amidase signature domain-containing protein [Nemania serpens]|nr:amidase signature domain-containing protein [Nemania serpens]
MRLNLLSATGEQLQKLLIDGDLTSEELIQISLAQIEAYDRKGPCLRAMINVTPRETLLAIARHLDRERADGGLRVMIDKDPSWGMPTTQGSKVLERAENAGEAKLVEKLRAAGMIILGKTNLSEFGASKGVKGIPGLSAIGGQANSAYVSGGIHEGDEPFAHSNPGGSSTSSAVSVAAGYRPVSISGEGDGSIMTPASRSALFGLKATPGTISTEGIFTMSPTFETFRPMAKSVKDLSDVTQIVLQAAKEPRILDVQFQNNWSGITLGFVDPEKWRLPEELFTSDPEYLKHIRSSIEDAISLIRTDKGVVHYPVSIIHPSEVRYNGQPGFAAVIMPEMRKNIDRYLNTLTKTPAQSNNASDTEFEEARAHVQKLTGDDGLLKLMDELGLDAICAPTDGPISTISALAGCPTATAPLGHLEPSGRPFGLTFLARRGREDTLIRLLSIFEATFPKRRLPSLL